MEYFYFTKFHKKNELPPLLTHVKSNDNKFRFRKNQQNEWNDQWSKSNPITQFMKSLIGIEVTNSTKLYRFFIFKPPGPDLAGGGSGAQP